MMRWVFLLALLPSVALAQHVKQPFSFLWEWSGPVDRFELKLDAGAYVSVGLPPAVAGTYTLPGDSSLAGSHTAIVRACTVAGCTAESNQVVFTVDAPAPAPIPPAPDGLRIVGVPLPPVGPVESPSGTQITGIGGPIIDHLLASWFLAPKDVNVEGGREFVIKRNGNTNGAATSLCYSGGAVYAFSSVWWKWTDDATLLRQGSFSQIGAPAPAGCI